MAETQNAEHLKTLRTLKGDIADMMNENKISRDALAKIDKKLEEQVVTYSTEGGDERFKPASAPAVHMPGIEDLAMKIPVGFRQKEAKDNDPVVDIDAVKREDIVKEIEKEFKPKDYAAGSQPASPTPVQANAPVPKKPEPIFVPEPIKIKTPEERVDDDIAALKEKAGKVDEKARALAEKMADAKRQQNSLKSSLEPILSKEKSVEAEEKELEKNIDAESSAEHKRELEEGRWKLEDERESIEKDRWTSEKNVSDFDASFKELEKEQQEIDRQKKELDLELSSLLKKKTAYQAQKEKGGIVKKLDDVKEKEKELEKQWTSIHADSEKLEANLLELSKKDETVKAKLRQTEELEAKAPTPEERHISEEERWREEKEHRDIEMQEWNAEEESKKIGAEIEDLQSRFQKIKDEELDLGKQVKDLDAKIQAGQLSV